jgi:hypothetical protein
MRDIYPNRLSTYFNSLVNHGVSLAFQLTFLSKRGSAPPHYPVINGLSFFMDL